MQLADGAGGRGDAGRGDGVQERGGDGLVEAAAAERLAGLAGAHAARGRARTHSGGRLPLVPE